MKSEITAAMLIDDHERNGIIQMLSDVDEARKTGVPFTEAAEAYLYDVYHSSERAGLVADLDRGRR